MFKLQWATSLVILGLANLQLKTRLKQLITGLPFQCLKMLRMTTLLRILSRRRQKQARSLGKRSRRVICKWGRNQKRMNKRRGVGRKEKRRVRMIRLKIFKTRRGKMEGKKRELRVRFKWKGRNKRMIIKFLKRGMRKKMLSK